VKPQEGISSGMRRRYFLQVAALTACLPLAACGNKVARRRFPGRLSDFEEVSGLPFRAFRIGPTTGRTVLVLHELPGLTQDDLALARALGQRGFNVFAPLLFGAPEQDSVTKGYDQACRSKLFACGELSTRSAILDPIDTLCAELAKRGGRTIGVIGMCLTGVFPLALLNDTSGAPANRVAAAVLCQPTVPFTLFPGRPTGSQKDDMGLGQADLNAATSSSVPFLLVRYVGDGRCPPERVDAFRGRFGSRMAVIDLPGSHHSSLAGDFDGGAFDDVVSYLTVRFDPAIGPRSMKLARLRPADPQPCEIGKDGLWHAS
jgi:dienelactone hydrolase